MLVSRRFIAPSIFPLVVPINVGCGYLRPFVASPENRPWLPHAGESSPALSFDHRSHSIGVDVARLQSSR